ncbi:hypothetical protein GJ496_010857 [Pomphorhynchus laevis]|nr:hypothetical protein GJ496_010857 [Pomphorhynchus laevis]
MNIHLLFKLLLVRLILSKAQTGIPIIDFTGNQNGTITANDVENLLNSELSSTLLIITISNASHIGTDVYRMLNERNIFSIVIDLKTVSVNFSSLGDYLKSGSVPKLELDRWTSDIDLNALNLYGPTFRSIEINVNSDNIDDMQKNPWALYQILIHNNYPQDRSLFDLINNWFDIIRSNQSTELILLNNTAGLNTYFAFVNFINRSVSVSNCSDTIWSIEILNVVNSNVEIKNLYNGEIELTFNNFNRSHLLIENITAVLLKIRITNITNAQWSFKNFLNVEIYILKGDLSFIKAIDNPAGITKLSIIESINYLDSIEFQRFTDLRYLTVALTEIDDNLTITLGNTNMTLTLYDNNIALKDKISNPSNVYEIQLKNGILSHPNFQNFTNLRQMSFSEIMIPSDSVIIMPDQENLTLRLSDLPDYSFELVKSINPKQFWEGNLYINGVKSNLSEIRNREDGNVADATDLRKRRVIVMVILALMSVTITGSFGYMIYKK